MSRDDAYYAPHRDNPFVSRFPPACCPGADPLTPASPVSYEPPFSPPYTPSSSLSHHHHHPVPRSRLRSQSLPNDSLACHDVPGACDAGSSSYDSALGVDLLDSSSSAAALDGAGFHDKMVQCLEDLDAFLDSSSDRHSLQCMSSPSCTSLEDSFQSLSMSNSFSSFNPASTFRQPASASSSAAPGGVGGGQPQDAEKIRALIAHWEMKQSNSPGGGSASNYTAGMPVRLRYVDPCVVQKFNELRRMWDEQQMLNSSSARGNINNDSRGGGGGGNGNINIASAHR